MSGFAWTSDHAKAYRDHHVIVCGKSESAAEKYCRVAGLFFRWVDENEMSLDSNTVREWMKYLAIQAKNFSNATRKTRLSSLKSVCKFLVERGDLDENPCEGVPSPKVQRKAAQKFSHNDLMKLFSQPEKPTVTSLRDRCILMMFYATGVRREEMSNITLDKLTMGSRTGRVHIIGKGAKHRVIPFEGPIVPTLKTWLMARSRFVDEHSQSLFVALHGNRHKGQGAGLSTHGLHDVIKRVAKRVGIHDESVFLHKIRSTFATDLYDAGVPIIEIALLMGHASTQTTEGYIAISERHLQKARIPTSRWKELGVNS